METDRTPRLMLFAGAVLLLVAIALGIATFLSRSAGPSAAGTATPAPAAANTPSAPATSATAAPASATAPAPTPPATSGAPAPPTPYLTPLHAPIVYAALESGPAPAGASTPAPDTWSARLAARLPARTRLVRAARPGLTLDAALTQEVSGVIAAQPTLVTVWLGAPDLLEGGSLVASQTRLNTLLGRLVGETRAQVVLLTIPNLSFLVTPDATPVDPAQRRTAVQSWNVALAATAAPYGARVLVVDTFPITSQLTAGARVVTGAGMWAPGPTGRQALADLVYAALLQTGLLPAQ